MPGWAGSSIMDYMDAQMKTNLPAKEASLLGKRGFIHWWKRTRNRHYIPVLINS
jgi:hypothetical protein